MNFFRIISHNFLGNAENQTWGCWVRRANATSVLCCPPLPWQRILWNSKSGLINITNFLRPSLSNRSQTNLQTYRWADQVIPGFEKLQVTDDKVNWYEYLVQSQYGFELRVFVPINFVSFYGFDIAQRFPLILLNI